MRVAEVALSECSIGDIIANDIYNKNGVYLLGKNTVINSYIKEKLSDMGVSRVLIYYEDPSSINQEVTDTYKNTIVLLKDTINSISSGKALEFPKIQDQSESIYNISKYSSSVLSCINEIQSFDEYTYSHCTQTAFYSMLLAKWLNLSKTEVKKAIQSGLLHDIGKSKIPIEILNKKGAISKEEFDIIKQHTVFGYKILDDLGENVDEEVKYAVLLHHERLDRLGYPLQASAEKINIFAKIVAITDVFGAMTNDRVYRQRLSPFDVFKMFLTEGLSCFDIELTNTFINNIAPFYIGSQVMLNNGEVGLIVHVPPQDVIHPIIQVDDKLIDLASNKNLKILYLV